MHRGRPPGLRNRLRNEFSDKFDELTIKRGFDPVDGMISLGADITQRLKDEDLLPDWRVSYGNLLAKICQSLMVYKYPKMQAIQLKIDDGPTVGEILDERINEILGEKSCQKNQD